MIVRKAKVEDAAEACTVLRRSIAELCGADHHGDPDILAQWLANKTPENVWAWIRAPDNFLLVAVDRGAIVGVGAITASGQVTLNYVSPDARFRGVSKALLRRLEAVAMDRGVRTCTLTSTETAHRFYASAGYRESRPAQHGHRIQTGYPMAKQLRAACHTKDRGPPAGQRSA
jgi:GNAT superfamily N-acetyltransferase